MDTETTVVGFCGSVIEKNYIFQRFRYMFCNKLYGAIEVIKGQTGKDSEEGRMILR